ncbi:MAG: hypothetical protein H0Z32_10565 [Bacillaceae bacterium]|nr:hypothetical protein [Bacillaceae bacterium]
MRIKYVSLFTVGLTLNIVGYLTYHSGELNVLPVIMIVSGLGLIVYSSFSLLRKYQD